ncbi:hypothetical protein M5K25_015011 [Dendrobium thyrsiflorum]|uniref:Uncharacterized protein n=1 Tax=Dendrobium thyrsiflorum TaxID=117978 RepID=A0ABD0UW64_DENTH
MEGSGCKIDVRGLQCVRITHEPSFSVMKIMLVFAIAAIITSRKHFKRKTVGHNASLFSFYALLKSI